MTFWSVVALILSSLSYIHTHMYISPNTSPSQDYLTGMVMVLLMLGSSISSGNTSTNGRVSLTATTEITQATLTSQSSPRLSMKWGSGFQQHFASWLSHDLIALLRSLWNLMTLSRAASCCGPWRRHSEHVTPTRTESSPLAMKTSWPWQFRTSLECALNCNSLSLIFVVCPDFISVFLHTMYVLELFHDYGSIVHFYIVTDWCMHMHASCVVTTDNLSFLSRLTFQCKI